MGNCASCSKANEKPPDPREGRQTVPDNKPAPPDFKAFGVKSNGDHNEHVAGAIANIPSDHALAGLKFSDLRVNDDLMLENINFEKVERLAEYMTEAWLHQVRIIVDEALELHAEKKTPADVSSTAFELSKSFKGERG